MTLDTMLDLAVFGAGNIVSFIAEREKEYVNRGKRNKKWVL